jgi:DNA-binding transcriptional ArsR family regulator
MESMERTIQETCDETCSGTEADLQSVKNAMIGDETIIALAEIFKALGDPTRVRIINALMQRELCVHDLTVVLGMGQSAVSHQLRVLRNLRIVKRRKVGKTVYYSLDDSHIEQIIAQTIHHIRHG